MKNIQLEADEHGFFGEYGGKYVPETLMPAIEELKKAYDAAKQDPEFQRDYHHYLKHYVGRETPLTYADSYTKALGGAKIYLKREDLNHTGAHKINNAIGQALLAKRMGKKKLVAETGAVNMVSQVQQLQRYSIWNSLYLWGKKISVVNNSMSFGWSYSGRKSYL